MTIKKLAAEESVMLGPMRFSSTLDFYARHTALRLAGFLLALLVIVSGAPTPARAQVPMLWEKWVATSSAYSVDVTSDGRYLVLLLRNTAGGDVLLVRDNNSNTLQGYPTRSRGSWTEMRIVGGSVVRVADRDYVQEFDLATRTWIRSDTNVLYASSTCKDKGGFVNKSYDLEHLLFVNHICTPVRSRLLRYADMVVVKDWIIPEPFTRVTYGRTPDEFIYYNHEIIGIESNGVPSDKRLTFPDIYHVDDVTTLHGRVYVLYSTDDKVHHLCIIDPDNMTVLKQVDVVTTDNSLRFVEGPTPDRLHLYGGNLSAQYDAVTLEPLGKTAVKTAHRILKIGDEFIVVESGRNIYRTTDPTVKGESLHYISKPIIGLVQDSRGRLLTFDDTLTFIDARTGIAASPGTAMPRGFLETWSYFIADETRDRVAIGASDEVVILEGEQYTTTSTSIPIRVATPDTFWFFNGALNFSGSNDQTSFWLSFRPGNFPYTFGGAVWSCTSQPNGTCTSLVSSDGMRYSRAKQTSTGLQAIEFSTSAGPAAIFVSDTTLVYDPLLRTGADMYALSTDVGFSIIDSRGTVVSAIAHGSKLVPKAVCPSRDLMLCWRQSDSNMVLIIITTGQQLWSMPFPTSPRHAVIDRLGMWMVIHHLNGHTIAYDISGVTSVEAPSPPPHLSPNPASDYTHANITEQATWTVVDALGREWIRGSSARIPLVGLPIGMYYVRTTSVSDTRTTTLCVQR